MEFSNNWDALLNTGEAKDYFSCESLEKFQIDATGCSMINAWWLAEFSRLIYKKEKGEEKNIAEGPKRRHILEQVGFKESCSFNQGGTFSVIIEPIDAGDEKFAVLVFRGNSEVWDVLSDLSIVPFAWSEGGIVHKMFSDALAKVWQDIDSVLASMNCPLYYAGHGIGAALATLAASRRPPQELYTFGSPRVGDADFVRTLKDVRVCRLVNNLDKITGLPLAQEPFNFKHAGELLYITHESRIIVNPDEETVRSDRAVEDYSLRSKKGFCRRYDPPQFLADHAAANYVAQLARQF